jgi:hypothetical protein
MGDNRAFDLKCQPEYEYDSHLNQVDPITRIPWGMNEEIGIVEMVHDEEEC